MKQIMKKVSSVCTALLCAASLTLAGSVVVFAEAEADAAAEAVTAEVTLESQLILNAEGLTETIIPLTDEEIEMYMESGDPFTESVMSAWVTSKDELGAFVALTETEVEVDEKEYTVTVNADFEAVDAEFVYHFNEKEGFTSVAINALYPMSVNMQRAGLNTLMGMGTVFVMLIFLSGVISLFKFIPALLDGKKKETPAPAAAPAPVAAPVVEEVADDTELIAVIAAAIAAAEGATSTDGFVVRSIRKVNRKKW